MARINLSILKNLVILIIFFSYSESSYVIRSEFLNNVEFVNL